MLNALCSICCARANAQEGRDSEVRAPGQRLRIFIPFSGAISWGKDSKEQSVLALFWAVGFAKKDSDDKPNMVLRSLNVKHGPPGRVEGSELKMLQASTATSENRGVFIFPYLVNKFRV